MDQINRKYFGHDLILDHTDKNLKNTYYCNLCNKYYFEFKNNTFKIVYFDYRRGYKDWYYYIDTNQNSINMLTCNEQIIKNLLE